MNKKGIVVIKHLLCGLKEANKSIEEKVQVEHKQIWELYSLHREKILHNLYQLNIISNNTQKIDILINEIKEALQLIFTAKQLEVEPDSDSD